MTKVETTSSLRLSLILLVITNTLPGPSTSEVTTLWRYTNIFIIYYYYKPLTLLQFGLCSGYLS